MDGDDRVNARSASTLVAARKVPCEGSAKPLCDLENPKVALAELGRSEDSAKWVIHVGVCPGLVKDQVRPEGCQLVTQLIDVSQVRTSTAVPENGVVDPRGQSGDPPKDVFCPVPHMRIAVDYGDPFGPMFREKRSRCDHEAVERTEAVVG